MPVSGRNHYLRPIVGPFLATTDPPRLGVPLTRSTSISQIQSEFDAFLYASVEEGSDRPLLSVISALARADVDPWQEAAKLSRMPRDKAAWRLAALIETLPSDSSTHMNCRTVATRLIALLPRQIAINVPSREATSPVASPASVRTFIALIMLNALFMAFFFGHRNIAASRPPTVQVAHAQSLASVSAKPTVPSSQPGNESQRNHNRLVTPRGAYPLDNTGTFRPCARYVYASQQFISATTTSSHAMRPLRRWHFT